jgi:hypothetical protein
VTVAVVAILATTVCARADEPFRLLSGKEIRPKVIGRDLTDGVHWSWYYSPNGSVISIEMGKRQVGSWKIEDNKLCSTNANDRPMECYEVWASGKNISLRYFADMPAHEAVVVPHTGH